MATAVYSTYISCGVHQLAGLMCFYTKHVEVEASCPATKATLLNTRKGMLRSLKQGYTYIFSDADMRGGGLNLAAIIRHHGLGQLTESPCVTNPNSGNGIRTWIWTYNGKVPEGDMIVPTDDNVLKQVSSLAA